VGQSTNGILCYGFCLPYEDEPIPWLQIEGEDDEEMEFDEFLAKLEGLEKPTADYKEDPKPHKAYWKAKDELAAKVGVTLVYHCSGDYSMYILAIRESEYTASRGYPKGLGQGLPDTVEWRDRLKAFCERAGIRFAEPQWILCSMWS
jgi:hypothetical protein